MHALRPALANIEVSTSLSSSNTLRSHLSRTGPRTPAVKDLPGVYQINCQQCPVGEGAYYGETGNSLNSRMSSHQSNIRDRDTRSSIYTHMRDNPGHVFNLDEPTMIYASNIEHKRKLVESSLIATRANLNLRPGDFPVCKLTAPVVLHALKLNTKLTSTSSPHNTSRLPAPSNPAPPAPPSTPQPPPPAPSTSPAALAPLPAPAPPSDQSPSPAPPTAIISPSPVIPTPPTSPLQAPIHPIPSSTSTTPFRSLHDDYVPSPEGPVFCRTRWGRNVHRITYRSRVAPYQSHSSQTSTTTIQVPDAPPYPVSSSAPLPVLPSSTNARSSSISAPAQPALEPPSVQSPAHVIPTARLSSPAPLPASVLLSSPSPYPNLPPSLPLPSPFITASPLPAPSSLPPLPISPTSPPSSQSPPRPPVDDYMPSPDGPVFCRTR